MDQQDLKESKLDRIKHMLNTEGDRFCDSFTTIQHMVALLRAPGRGQVGISHHHLRKHLTPIPRIRDFRGISGKSFDGRGNYALGLKEQIVFPEIDYDKIDSVRGMDIIIVTTAKTDEEAKALLKGFSMPFIN